MRGFERIFLYLFFPGLILFWGLGWLLYWIGIQRNSAKPQKSSTQNDLEMFVLTTEEDHLAKEAFSESSETVIK